MVTNELFLHTAPSGSPVNITIKVQSSQAVLIVWKPPELLLRNGVIIKYHLMVHNLKNGNLTINTKYAVSGNTSSVLIEGMYAML